MKITVVCDILGAENNGTTIASMNLIRYLSKHHEVKVLCCDPTKKNLPNYYVTKEMDFGDFINKHVFDKCGYKLAKPDTITVKKAIVNADIVHVITPFGLGCAAAKFASEIDKPVTAGFHILPHNISAYVHFFHLHFLFLNTIIFSRFWKALYCHCNAIHYPTQFTKNIFEKYLHFKTNGYVISNGVNDNIHVQKVEKPDKYKDKIVIVCCGRFNREKSQDTLIKAVKRSEFVNKIQLIFIGGSGLLMDKYKKMSSKLPIEPVFVKMKHDELINVVNYCDLFVHPADIEIEGIAVLEAMACGKLVIVSDSKTSATRDFAIDGKCIFKKRNSKSLANCIDFWIKNSELRKQYEQKYAASPKVLKQSVCMKSMEKMLVEVYNECQRLGSSKLQRELAIEKANKKIRHN